MGTLRAASQETVKCKGNNVVRVDHKHLMNISGGKNLFGMRVAYAVLTLAFRSTLCKMAKIHLDFRVGHVKFSFWI